VRWSVTVPSIGASHAERQYAVSRVTTAQYAAATPNNAANSINLNPMAAMLTATAHDDFASRRNGSLEAEHDQLDDRYV
jgi:hypothetical protein